MLATKFEFENRFWIIGLIFFLAFGMSNFDHVNFAVGLLHLLAPAIDPDTAQGHVCLRIIFGCGASLVFFAAFLRTWAAAYLCSEVVHDVSQHSDVLVADGPYRYVRNPLYLANIPMAVGVGAITSRVGFFFLVLAMFVFMYRLILREEEGLRKTQGESYRVYLEAVPRFWFSLSRRVPSSGRQPRWGQGVAGELFIWLFGVGVLCLAVTLNVKYTLIVFVASFAVYFTAIGILKRRSAQSAPKA